MGVAKAKPIIHIETVTNEGKPVLSQEELILDDKQIEWLAQLFAPMVKERLRGDGS